MRGEEERRGRGTPHDRGDDHHEECPYSCSKVITSPSPSSQTRKRTSTPTISKEPPTVLPPEQSSSSSARLLLGSSTPGYSHRRLQLLPRPHVPTTHHRNHLSPLSSSHHHPSHPSSSPHHPSSSSSYHHPSHPSSSAPYHHHSAAVGAEEVPVAKSSDRIEGEISRRPRDVGEGGGDQDKYGGCEKERRGPSQENYRIKDLSLSHDEKKKKNKSHVRGEEIEQEVYKEAEVVLYKASGSEGRLRGDEEEKMKEKSAGKMLMMSERERCVFELQEKGEDGEGPMTELGQERGASKEKNQEREEKDGQKEEEGRLAHDSHDHPEGTQEISPKYGLGRNPLDVRLTAQVRGEEESEEAVNAPVSSESGRGRRGVGGRENGANDGRIKDREGREEERYLYTYERGSYQHLHHEQSSLHQSHRTRNGSGLSRQGGGGMIDGRRGRRKEEEERGGRAHLQEKKTKKRSAEEIQKITDR